MSKNQEPRPFIDADGTQFEYVWRIRHRPSGVFFKPGNGFSTVDPRLAKTYSRKPALAVAISANYNAKKINGEYPKQGYVNFGNIGWRDADEFEVVEYLITPNGKTYAK